MPQEDSILLWRSIVKHPLLKNTELILFLNKCDLLRAKLESGVQFAQWVVSYGDRANDFESVSNCEYISTSLRQRGVKPLCFVPRHEEEIWYANCPCTCRIPRLIARAGMIHKQLSEGPRTFYCHFTSVTVGSDRI